MRRALRLALICFTFACVRATDTSVDERTHSVPASRLIRVGSGVSLEIVDWGGRGPSLVFLAGLGSTAHVFDEFAPQFTDSFHVVGLTRRGFGASAGSLPPTDLDTLVSDIRAVLDTLDLPSVTLVGHSIAGEEMTRFGDVDATRCAALIYLDAAYDRTPQPNINAPSMPLPPPRAYAATYAAWQAYRKRVMGIQEPESEIRATSRFDEKGRYVGEVTPDSSKARIVRAVRVPRYDRARCPALALYAAPTSPTDVVPYYAELDSTGRAHADTLLAFVASFVASSRTAFERFPQHRAAEIHGNHFVFLEHPDEVARRIRAFLIGVHRDASP